ncbi:LacI family DNA-binding transcriptional regulator [Niabella beijingensis]|uniref:LacI family DNA-binding transcriptional regulator n=1 Tax=Niabella beijingensis TaxID=2872700 RepID=UPI001CBA88D0|nr:LacI family DNA-binding transcriptional regulator [Niabella beijingensis]MBZ4191889.1 LacI family transcriptional regulator [Niabella beijingensis]
MKKEVTIYDIARKLNLSTATVSRALDNNALVKEKTKEKVMAAAEKMGYRQNLLAKNLRQQQSRTIGVLLHEVNSYFATSVLAGIEKITTQEKYDILIAHSNEDGLREIANTKNLFNKRVDGLIVSQAMTSTGTDHFMPYIDRGIPVIFFDRVPKNISCTKIIIDNLQTGYNATAHLIQQGYRRIAHITASLERNVYNERFKGYKKALKKYNIPYDEALVGICSLDHTETLQALNQLLLQQPDAFFITNDFAAAVCINELHRLGYHIPDDIGVVGYNNDVLGSLITPKLSTVDYPGILMGELAAQELINAIKQTKKEQRPDKRIVLSSELIIRESSVPPRSKVNRKTENN